MVLATVLVTAVNYWLVADWEMEELEQKADNYIEHLVESLELSLWTINEEHILKIAESYYNNELVAKLRITEGFSSKALFDQEKEFEGLQLIERSSDIVHDGLVIGNVEISLTPNFYQEQLSHIMRTSLITALVIISSMIVMTSIIFRLLLAKPLSLLIEGTNAIGESDYQFTEKTHKYREIDSVLAKFREMGKKVQQREASLLEMNTRLENEILERNSVEKSLRTSEERLQSIINNMGSLLYLKDPAGKYLLINNRFEKEYGIARDEMIGKDDYALFGEVTAKLVRKNDDLVLKNGKAMRFEEVIERPGKAKVYLSVKFPLREASGEVYAVCGLSTDITEHKNIQRRISEALEFNEKIISESPIGISIYHETGVCIAANQSLASMVGTTREELRKRNLFDDDVWNNRILLDIARSAVSDQKKKRTEIKSISHFGRSMALDCHIVPFHSAGKKHILFMAVDISKRIRAEEESDRLRLFLNNIIDSMPSIIVGVDLEDQVTLWNVEAEVHTGLPSEVAVGRQLSDVYPLLSKEKNRFRDAIEECRPVEVPRMVVGEENGKHYYDMVIYPLVTNGLGGVVMRIHDVTERVRLEELMVQSEKMMSIGGLAAGMAHEINNPLAAILQNVQLLRNRLSFGIAKNQKVADEHGISIEAIEQYMGSRGIFKMIDAILSAGQRASKIVENMLNFSRKSDTRFIKHDLAELLDRTIELAENDYDLKKKYDFRQINITRDYDANLPKVACEGSQIQQVFLNILKNGAQAMGDVCRLDRQPSRFLLTTWSEANVACIAIEDNGPGMDEEVRKRVFEPFFTTKDVGIGTGLGLSLSYFIVTKNHNGHMSVESNPFKGTRFIIRLPIDQTNEP